MNHLKNKKQKSNLFDRQVLRFVKKGITVLSLMFCFFVIPNLQAQQSLNASNSSQILAAQLNVKAYPNGTFDVEKTFLMLNEEMDKMSNDFSRGLTYRYYWLVAVDVKRLGLPLEESLLKNLNKAGREFGVPNTTLQKLYLKTIANL